MTPLELTYQGPVERDIAPPMKRAITITIKNTNVVIYVAEGAFTTASRKEIEDVAAQLMVNFPARK